MIQLGGVRSKSSGTTGHPASMANSHRSRSRHESGMGCGVFLWRVRLRKSARLSLCQSRKVARPCPSPPDARMCPLCDFPRSAGDRAHPGGGGCRDEPSPLARSAAS